MTLIKQRALRTCHALRACHDESPQTIRTQRCSAAAVWRIICKLRWGSQTPEASQSGFKKSMPCIPPASPSRNGMFSLRCVDEGMSSSLNGLSDQDTRIFFLKSCGCLDCDQGRGGGCRACAQRRNQPHTFARGRSGYPWPWFPAMGSCDRSSLVASRP